MQPKIIGSCNHIHQYDLREFKGRAFATSDIHGNFDLLHERLRDVAFDSSRDILFNGGDVTDRSPDSKYVLDYILEPWFHSVRGNHCELFIQAFRSHWHPNDWNTITLMNNGGGWVEGLTHLEKILIHDAFSAMPLGIELLMPDDKVVGIIHAQCPYEDWNKFKNITKAELEYDGETKALWARTRYDRQDKSLVKGVDLLLVGHTVVDSGEPELLGNVLFCDLGSFFRNKLAMVDIGEYLKGMK